MQPMLRPSMRQGQAHHALSADILAREQSVMMFHWVRLILNRQRTQISNALRSHLSEFGFAAPVGRNCVEQLLVSDENDYRMPADARLCLRMLNCPVPCMLGRRRAAHRHPLPSAKRSTLSTRCPLGRPPDRAGEFWGRSPDGSDK
jgi:hypothetical protein